MSRRFRRYRRAQRRIPGWFEPGAAAVWDCLLEYQAAAKIRGDGLEIGVWHGRSAALLAMHADPERERVLLLDKHPSRRKVSKALRRVGRELGAGVELLGADSREVEPARLDPDGARSFRWIHIDGEHTERAVRSDLALADRLLADRGVVCLDDFFSPCFPQVSRAVFAHLAEHPGRYALFLCGFNKGYLARPLHAREYLRFCHEELAAGMQARRFDVTLWKTTDPEEMNCFGIARRLRGDPILRGPDWDPAAIRY